METVRDAAPGDAEALARLIVQLYEEEAPGMMGGPERDRVALIRELLAATPPGLRSVVEDGGRVVATAALATAEDPRPATPPRVVLRAPAVLGPVQGLRTILGAARAVSTVASPPGPREAQIHSFVVDRGSRRGGVGGRLIARVEDEARARGKDRAVLQVVTANAAAVSFYRAAGYRPLDRRVPAVRRLVAYPSVLMDKDLAP